MAADQNLNQVLRDLHAADNTNTGDPPDDIDYFDHTFTENTWACNFRSDFKIFF